MTVLNLYRGDDRVLDVTLTDPGGGPLDLTGAALQFTVKRRLADADEDAAIVKTIADGIEVDDDAGTAAVTLASSDTEGLDPAVPYVWDIQLIDAESKIHTVATGRLVVIADVTRTGLGS